MVHSFEDAGLEEAGIEHPAESLTDTAGLPGRILAAVNNFIVISASVALVIAACVLTYSVITRYFLHLSTDWQDEMSVFLIVGAVFMSAAAVQARRGHVGIEAIVGLLSPRVNHIRQILVDVATFIFCGYFSWKSALLLHEAIVEGFRTSSTWQPPLWIPYSLMTAGMALLSIQVLLQIVVQLRHRNAA
jgi:TRAP-type C4-dicarboxylate transport system permease small subunit